VPVIPPQGFRHAVDLLLKNGSRSGGLDTDRVARDLLALSDDMKARPEFAEWTMAEFERVLRTPAPAILRGVGQTHRVTELRDLFIVYVPEDRLPMAAPLAVELAKRGLQVGFSEFEVESQEQLERAMTDGLFTSRVGVLFITPDFLRRGLRAPAEHDRLKVIGQMTSAIRPAEVIARWVSTFKTT
jgi:hypothetical protein